MPIAHQVGIVAWLGIIKAVVKRALLVGHLIHRADGRMPRGRHRLRLLACSIFDNSRSFAFKHIFLHACNALICVTHLKDLAVVTTEVDMFLLDN